MQDWNGNPFDPGNVWSVDLQNIENALLTLNTLFSGTTAPANPEEGKPWRDTDKNVTKIYNGGAWEGLMHGSANHKAWFYRNDAEVGWVIDPSVSDCVIAAKGGSTYTTAGATAGSWTISGVSAHAHTFSHKHETIVGTSAAKLFRPQSGDAFGSGGSFTNVYSTPDQATYTNTDTYSLTNTPYGGSTTSSETFTQASSWRIAAAVNTLQYLDL